MFAAGSGLAPFLGFVDALTGPGLLYLGIRTPDELIEHAGLDAAAAAGRLTLSVAFSRADAAVTFDGRRHVVGSGSRRRVDDVIRAEADTLGEMLQTASLYVCGSSTFAASVIQALTDIVPGDGREFIRRLVAEGRLSLDVFTTYLGHAQQTPRFEVSDLARHDTAESGYWMAVGGAVIDVSEFIHLHIGGPHIVRNYVGMDATAAYRKVLHHANAEIDSQLSMYQIGHLRRLQFDARWGVVLTEEGLRSMPLEELFRTWVRFLYMLVGMSNALTADYGFTASVSTAGEDPGELTPFKAQYVIEAHRRFLVSYLDGLLNDDLRVLWQLTVGFCDPQQDIRSYDTELAALSDRPDVTLVRRSVSAVKGLLRSGNDFSRVTALCRTYAYADVQLLRDLKTAVLAGIRAFETHEADVVEQAGPTLLNVTRDALAAVTAYYQRLGGQTRGQGIAAGDGVEEAIPPDKGLPGHGGPLPLSG